MSFNKQIEAARKIMEFLEAEAPQDHNGVIERPYRDWIAQLRKALLRAKEWTRENGDQAAGQNNSKGGD